MTIPFPRIPIIEAMQTMKFPDALVLNNDSVSKLWFKAHRIPISNKYRSYLKQINNVVNECLKRDL